MSQVLFQKMFQVANEFGLDLGKQGSTANFFQDLPVATNQTNYSFFDTLGTVPAARRNLTDNKFPVNQAAIIEFISFPLFGADASVFSGLLPTSELLHGARFNVFIGNTNVIKNALYVPNGADGYPGQSVPQVMAMESPLVIPPLSTFKITLDLQTPLLPADYSFIGCQIIGRVAYPTGTY